MVLNDVCAMRATGAQVEFDAVLQSSSDDYVAANNKAICMMYACNLTGAVEVTTHHSLVKRVQYDWHSRLPSSTICTFRGLTTWLL